MKTTLSDVTYWSINDFLFSFLLFLIFPKFLINNSLINTVLLDDSDFIIKFRVISSAYNFLIY